MKVTITLYGKLRNLIAGEVELGGQEAETVAELRKLLAARYPEASGDLLSPRVRACVNDAVVPDTHPLTPGDSVALLPPVSGG